MEKTLTNRDIIQVMVSAVVLLIGIAASFCVIKTTLGEYAHIGTEQLIFTSAVAIILGAGLLVAAYFASTELIKLQNMAAIYLSIFVFLIFTAFAQKSFIYAASCDITWDNTATISKIVQDAKDPNYYTLYLSNGYTDVEWDLEMRSGQYYIGKTLYRECEYSFNGNRLQCDSNWNILPTYANVYVRKEQFNYKIQGDLK